jgi:hypothetical protein
VCARNAASVFAMRTEELLREHGGGAGLTRAQLSARPQTIDDGFEWVRRLGAHADALDHFERTRAFEPQRRFPGLRLRVGQLVSHSHFHQLDSPRGIGVIYGWQPSCEAQIGSHEAKRFVDNRETFARIDRAAMREQPFYRLMTRGGESRLVAQELLTPLAPHDASADRPVEGASFFFTRIIRRGQYEANAWLREAYPDDAREASAAPTPPGGGERAGDGTTARAGVEAVAPGGLTSGRGVSRPR